MQPKIVLKIVNCKNSQVIVVDWNEKVVDCNRENALLLKKWEGDNTDRSLIGLAQLLQGENTQNTNYIIAILFLFYSSPNLRSHALNWLIHLHCICSELCK